MVYLLKTESNYADEFDVDGLLEISKEKRDELVNSSFAPFKEEYELSFGTNEFVYMNEIDAKILEISESDLEVLKRVFGTRPGCKFHTGILDVSSYI